MSKGYVYILTNPSMPGWVKIGSTRRSDIEKRLKELSKPTSVPLSFVAHATLATDDFPEEIEHCVHDLIDEIDPELRATEVNEYGKKRKREFFQVDPDTAFRVLEKVAKISRNSVLPEKPTRTAIEKEEEDLAKRRRVISFAELGIPVGSELIYVNNEKIKCKVVDEKRTVSYEGKNTSLSALAQKLSNSEYRLQGTAFWKYEDETLWDRRLRLENK